MNLDTAKIVAEILESIVKTAGIIVAGVWTYLVFVQRRQRFPRATVSHQVHHYRLTDGRTLLRIAARIFNSGEVLVRMRFVRTRVQQFFPMPDHIASLVCQSADPVSAEECELPWSVLGAREWRIDETLGEVEPGESEVLYADFIVPVGVGQIIIYTYVTNSAKRNREIGWSDTLVVSLKEPEPHDAPTAVSGA